MMKLFRCFVGVLFVLLFGIQPSYSQGLPIYFDWRDHGILTPVKDQVMCNSCWAFSTIACLEASVNINESVVLSLSEQQLISCIPNTNCFTERTIDTALRYIQDHGSVGSDCMSYQEDGSMDCIQDECSTLARISGWAMIELDATAIKNAVMQGPVMAEMRIFDDFYSFFTSNPTGCYTVEGAIDTGGHAVSIVGWDDTLCGGVWICRDSRGDGVLDAGYFRLGYGICGIESKVFTLSYEEVTPVNLVFSDWALSDSSGNSDGVFDPGETISLSTYILNNGTGTATGVSIRLESLSEYVAIFDSTANCANIPPGEIRLTGQPAASFYLSPGTPPGTEIHVGLTLISDQDTSFYDRQQIVGRDVNYVSGFISDNTTWSTPDIYIVTGDITVAYGAELTIEPNVIVKFEPGTRLRVGYGNDTDIRLIAQGDSLYPVVFTSSYDDNAGGDTNLDGSATGPSAGDWDNIYFDHSPGSLLDWCEIRYAGSSGNGAVELYQGSHATIMRCAIHNSASAGIYVYNSDPYILGNYISNNPEGAVRVSAGVAGAGCSPHYYSDTFPGLYNEFVDNEYDAVVFSTTNYIGSSTWRWSGYPWYAESGVNIYKGHTLTIESGVVVKMGDNTMINAFRDGYGGGAASLSFIGSDEDSIIITSIHDDSYGGDTNNDSTATMPVPGDWDRIRMKGEELSMLEYCHIRYAGQSGAGALELTGNADVTIKSCQISLSSSPGISVYKSSPWLIGNKVSDNHEEAVRVSSGVAGDGCSPYFYSDSYPGLSNEFVDNEFDVVVFNTANYIGTSTWRRSGYPWHVESGVNVYPGHTLTIDPGVVIKMGINTSINAFLDGYGGGAGHLDFKGTELDSIVITSIRDDSYGGDSNKDSTATCPAPGDWDRIRMKGEELSMLEYCNIRYAGHSGAGSLELTGGGNVTIKSCQIGLSSSPGVFVYQSSPWLIGNKVSDNHEEAVRVSSGVAGNGSSPYFFSATYPGLSNEFADNEYDAVVYNTTNYIGTSTWRRSGYPWHVESGVNVYPGHTLVIEPGVVVKMAPNTSINAFLDGYGGGAAHLWFIGTMEDSIVITSIRDDHYGGDSNDDNTTTAPAPGDWGKIRMKAEDESVLEYCHIRYAGESSNGAIEILDGCNMELRNTLVGFSDGYGISISNSSPTITYSRIDNTNDAGIYCANSSPVITNNIFEGDTSWVAVQNVSLGIEVSVENNWWWHDTGPYDPSPIGLYNPGGYGTRVSDYVDYSPWLSGLSPVIELDHYRVSEMILPDHQADHPVTVRNHGGEPLTYEAFEATAYVASMPGSTGQDEIFSDGDRPFIRADVPWLSFFPASREILPGQSSVLTVSIDVAGLSEETCHAYIVLATNDPENSYIVIPVDVEISPLIVLLPFDGARVENGEGYLVRWMCGLDGLIDVSLSLSCDAGRSYDLLQGSIDPVCFAYDWYVDHEVADSCKIMVTACFESDTLSVYSEGYFVIQDSITVTGDEEIEDRIPAFVVLSQNYPNPFNPITSISFSLPRTIRACLYVYNVEGKLVSRLFDGIAGPGNITVRWDGRNENANQVNSGVYFYQLRTSTDRITKKMVLLR